MKKNWQLWVGIAVSVVAMVLALRKIDPREVAGAFAQANYLYLVPALAAMLLYLLARAVRWRILLGPQVSLARCFWIGNIGYLVSNVFPLRLGDPARAVIVGRDGSVSIAAALSTVVVERVLDMLMVVMLLAGVVPFMSGAGDAITSGIVAGAAALAALAVLLLFAFRPDWGRRLVRWALGFIPRIDRERWAHALDGLFDGLAPLRSGRRGLALLAWSVAAWACVVGYYWALLRAFLPQPPALAALFTVSAIGLGMAVPSTPGAMGLFHAIARYALTIPFGVPDDEAVSIAFASHIFQYIVILILGLVGLGREGLSLTRLRADVSTTLAEEHSTP